MTPTRMWDSEARLDALHRPYGNSSSSSRARTSRMREHVPEDVLACYTGQIRDLSFREAIQEVLLRWRKGRSLRANPDNLRLRLLRTLPGLEDWVLRREDENERGTGFATEWMHGEWGHTHGTHKKANHALADVTSLLVRLDDTQYERARRALVSWLVDVYCGDDGVTGSSTALAAAPSALRSALRLADRYLPLHVQRANAEIEDSIVGSRFYRVQDRRRAEETMRRLEAAYLSVGDESTYEDVAELQNELASLRVAAMPPELRPLLLLHGDPKGEDDPDDWDERNSDLDSTDVGSTSSWKSDYEGDDVDDALEDMVADGWLVGSDDVLSDEEEDEDHVDPYDVD